MKYFGLFFILGIAGCAIGKDAAAIKYDHAVAGIEAQAARGEISYLEAESMKLQAHQEYLEVRRREEKQFSDDVSRQIKNQNQDVNAMARPVRP